MAIDIRATVVCSLGTLISGSLSDDYLQGSGLIKTRGTVEISGLITPAIGTVVTFTYTKNAVQRSIPRTMRVMSSFADPYRRTTKVELGCKLTYFSDLEEPLNWEALDDPENAGLVEADTEIVTVPIYAKSIAAECCTQLGLDPTPVSVLTNKFSIAEFDFSSGYVNILSDLLVSESYCGYLNASEDLVLIDLSADGGTGPVLDETKLIDLGPIGTGQLPGEAVIVEYSSLKLTNPDGTVDGKDSVLLWELSESTWEASYLLTWRPDGGALQSRIFRGIESISTTREFQQVGNRSLVVQETTETNKLRAGVCGNACQTWLAIGGVPNSNPELLLTSKQIIDYEYDENGNIQRQETNTFVQTSHIIGKFGLPLEYSDLSYVFIGAELPSIPESREVVTYTRTDDPILIRRYGYGPTSGTFYQTQEQKTTELYLLPSEVIEGQQTIATAGTFMDTATEAAAYYNAVIDNGPVLDRVVVDGGKQLFAPQERPPTAELLNSARGQTVESSAEIVLALGSAEAQRRITFRMPYAPDDTFSGPTGGPFTATPSDAEQKAITYGRVQNRLLLGNRNGMNVQVAPEYLPAAPFAPLYIQANGLTALYRVNGSQWSFSSDGIACSTDALFSAAVGGTGTFDIASNPGVIWFPVSPTVTTLPAAPAPVDGEITTTPGETIPPFNETVLLALETRTQLVVTSLGYALNTEDSVVLETRTELTATEIETALIQVPAAGPITVTAQVPNVLLEFSPPTVSIAVAAFAPDIVAPIQVPSAAITVGTNPPVGAGAGIFSQEGPAIQVEAHAPSVEIPVPPPAYIDASYSGPFNGSTGTYELVDAFGYSFSIVAPPEVDEIAILAIIGDGQSNTPTLSGTVSSGWTAISGTPVVDVATAAGTSLWLYWRRLVASDVDSMKDLTVSDIGDHVYADVYRFSGCTTSGSPIDDVAVGTEASATTSMTYPSVTTTDSNRLVVFFLGAPSGLTNTTLPSNGNLTSVAWQDKQSPTAGNDSYLELNTGIAANAGSLGTSSSTSTESTTRVYVTLALKP